MIRTVSIPRNVSRLGIVQSGAGGNAGNYLFDSDGLSNDPQLAPYLQGLTPAQLQTALSPDPTGELQYQQTLSSFNAYINSGLNCDGTNCGANIPQNPLGLPSIPTWVWWAGVGLTAAVLLAPRR